MQRLIGIVLLVVGIILLVWGYNGSQSVVSQAKESLTGSFTDKTMWLLIGGAVCAVAGLVLTFMPRRRIG
jgi:drug/metabolite transporter (DMT)-like permease